MNEQLTFEAFYPHPPERVWQALTDPASIGKWLLPTNFKPLIGFRFRFENLARGKKTTVESEVVELKAGETLAYTWDDGEAGSPSVVRWNLRPVEGGTRLTLEHVSAEPVAPYVVIEANLNWRYALYTSLPMMLAVPVPIIYVAENEPKQPKLQRAGFRQEEPVCP